MAKPVSIAGDNWNNAIANTERNLDRLLFGGTQKGTNNVTKGLTAAQQAALMSGNRAWLNKVK